MFLVHHGEFLETPYHLSMKSKSKLKTGLEFLKNEGLEDVIVHNSRNYFKIYQNDYKAIVALVSTETDKALIAQVKREFGKTARRHREFRKDYGDRYTFIFVDLANGDKEFNKMVDHVVGKQRNPFDVYLFNRAMKRENFDNFRLTENLDDVRNFLNQLPFDLNRFHALRTKSLKKSDSLTEEEEMFLEGAKKYEEEWAFINGALSSYEAGAQGGWDHLNEKKVLGFINAHDMNQLKHKFFKSEDEDVEYNREHLSMGMLQITGKNFGKLVLNQHRGLDDLADELEEHEHQDEPVSYPAPNYSFLLLVCRKIDKRSEKNCQQARSFLIFLQSHFAKTGAGALRLGMMDHEWNEHQVIEKLDIENFPVLLFFGRKAAGKPRIFKKAFRIQSVVDWLNKKLLFHEGTRIVLNDEEYQELFLIMAKNPKERKKLERLLKRANKLKEQDSELEYNGI